MIGKKRKNKSKNDENYETINKRKKLKDEIKINNMNQNIIIPINIVREIARLNTKNDVILTIGNETKIFHTPEKNLELAEKEFKSFLKIKNDKEITNDDKFKKLSKIIEICEINPEYNFYYLQYYSTCLNINNKTEFYEDQEILNFTLTEENYRKLYNKDQKNIYDDLFRLLKLCDNENKSIRLDDKNKYNNFNIPLIKAPEKFRLNLYKHRINELSPDVRTKIYNYRDLILELEKKFKNMDLEAKEINILIYFLILCITEINNEKSKIWFSNYFKQFLEPKKQILDEQNVKNFCLYSSNVKTNAKIIVKDPEKNEYIIHNNFDVYVINGNDYVISNLIKEFSFHLDVPLNVILKRNESFHKYTNKNKQIIEDEEIFLEFKNYFNKFIHSKLMKEVLGKYHKNIIELIDSNCFGGLFLDNEYVKPLPLYDLIADGYTDKDIVISFISYFPIIIENYGLINNKKQYENIKNVFFLFDVCYKFISSLHEIIIHLCYGYIYYITEGKIGCKSPKSSKNKLVKDEIDLEDGGDFLEDLLFGTDMKSINLQLIYCLLNGEYLDKTLKEFQKDLKLKFKPSLYKKKGLFGKILSKYKIDFSLFQYSATCGNMRQKSKNFLFAKRGRIIENHFNNISSPFFRKDILNKNKNDFD